jgi:hypothetical protein
VRRVQRWKSCAFPGAAVAALKQRRNAKSTRVSLAIALEIAASLLEGIFSGIEAVRVTLLAALRCLLPSISWRMASRRCSSSMETRSQTRSRWSLTTMCFFALEHPSEDIFALRIWVTFRDSPVPQDVQLCVFSPS